MHTYLYCFRLSLWHCPTLNGRNVRNSDFYCSAEYEYQPFVDSWRKTRRRRCACVQDSQSARDRLFSGHVILVLCAGSHRLHEMGLVNFVRPLRTSSLLTHQLRDIVFYADPALVEADWKTIANFPRLFVYPVWSPDFSLGVTFSLLGRTFDADLGYFQSLPLQLHTTDLMFT